MDDLSKRRALLEENLATIYRIIAIVCRKNGLWEDRAEDFQGWVILKLLEDDCAVMGKYRGESTIQSYLAVVIGRYFAQYAREQWGRWRNSAAAERLGQLAKDLETLVIRDGWSLAEAGEMLRTSGRTELSDLELGKLLAQLPSRAPLRPREVGSEALDEQVGPEGAEDRIWEADARERWETVTRALGRVIARLEPEDALIVRMHFADGRSIADVARALNLEQKPLYRRVERLRTRLRKLLEDEGVTGTDDSDLP